MFKNITNKMIILVIFLLVAGCTKVHLNANDIPEVFDDHRLPKPIMYIKTKI
jgi:hypothetical protein